MREVLLIAGLLGLVACADEAAEDAAISPVETELPEDGPTLAEGVRRDVMIGKDGPQMDACGSFGRASSEAVVRVGPTDSAIDKDRIKQGAQIIACDASEDGEWLGVVYHPSLPELPDCGTGSPVADVQPYRGACSSGWIRAEQFELIAG